MEFKLNKIDTDIRKKIQEETKEDKVHSGKGINVNKDLKDEKSYESTKEKVINENNEKKYITIDGIMYSSKNIKIKAEKMTQMNGENVKGRVLDTTK